MSHRVQFARPEIRIPSNTTAQARGSSDVINLDGPGPLADLSMPKPKPESILKPGRGAPASGMQTLTCNAGFLTSSENLAGFQHFGLSQFFNDANGPWNLVNPVSKSNGIPQFNFLSGRMSPSAISSSGTLPVGFDGYHDSIALSECGTTEILFSDSGYGSLHQKSVKAPSVHSEFDRTLESPSSVLPYNDFHVRSRTSRGQSSENPLVISPDNASEKSIAVAASQKDNSAQGSFKSSTLTCEICSKPVKNKSDLKKHNARHLKPHTCDVPRCTRSKDGFSTLNDLKRHKESVHSAGGIKYKCPLGQCLYREKKWPRADNFRSHLKRVHQREAVHLDELEAYICRETDANSTTDSTLNSMPESTQEQLANLAPSAYMTPDILAGLGPSVGMVTPMDTDTQQQPAVQGSWMGLDQSHLKIGNSPVDLCATGGFSQTRDGFGSDDQALVDRLHVTGMTTASNPTRRQDQDLRPLSEAQTQTSNEPLSQYGSSAQGSINSHPASSRNQVSGLASSQIPEPGVAQPTFSRLLEQEDEEIVEAIIFNRRAIPAPEGSTTRFLVTQKEQELQIPQPGKSPEDSHQGDEEELDRMDVAYANGPLSASDMPNGTTILESRETVDGHNSANTSELHKAPSTVDGATPDVDDDDDESDEGTVDESTATCPRSLDDQHDEDGDVEGTPHSVANTPGSPNPPMDQTMDEIQVSTMLESWDRDALEKLVERLTKRLRDGNSVQVSRGRPRKSRVRRIVCEKCNKVFLRPCELKKHMKRHEKPYGCTFPDCTKRFGSKNDWKRHENSQHFQLEVWRCEEPLSHPQWRVCQKVCYRRESFRAHLERDHQLGETAIEEKCSQLRLGRNCESRFWCGFCRRTIEIAHQGGGAWAERFDHIDRHFTGRDGLEQKDISEWHSIDHVLPDLFPEVSPPPPREYSPPAEETLQPTKPSLIPLKRRREAEAEVHGHVSAKARGSEPKRTREDQDAMEMWKCCNCQSTWNLELSSCQNPDCRAHIQCSNCVLESHWVTGMDWENSVQVD